MLLLLFFFVDRTSLQQEAQKVTSGTRKPTGTKPATTGTIVPVVIQLKYALPSAHVKKKKLSVLIAIA